MSNIYVTETLSGATFTDGSVLSGSWVVEYSSTGAFIAMYQDSFTLTSASGASTATWGGGTETGSSANASGSPYLIHATGSTNLTYGQKLYIDYSGYTASTTTLVGGTSYGTTTGYSTSADINGTETYLQSLGTITTSTDTTVTSSITGATFADGSTVSGTWTSIYDASGNLVGVENSSFVVSGTDASGNKISTTFTMGVLYGSATGSSFEIHSLSQSNYDYSALYIDWKSENPTALYEGTSTEFTSVAKTTDSNTVSSPPTSSTAVTSAIRLTNPGTTGTGTTAVITGLSSTQSGSDTSVVTPFAGVTVTDSNGSTSATITLFSSAGVATDADGVLSGTGLTKVATGTYTLASTTPASLSSELQALKFTPVVGEVSAGNTVSTQIVLAVNDSSGSVSGSTVLTETATCFVRGTLIATPSGDVAVEDLCAGDMVIVMAGGEQVVRPLVWAGRGHMDAARFDYRSEAFPVRIQRGAFGDGLPARDLLVTPEHCLLTEAGLTPARMLVNGASIVIDRSMPVYDFFHLELDRHGIVLAEGLATESYLDTGNRGLFAGDGTALAVRHEPAMAAPLAVARALVQPVWQRLADRARDLGLAAAPGCAPLTEDPRLRLLLDDGRELYACWHDAAHHMFHIPRGRRAMRLLSRAAVPADVIGPFVDDRRTLGVAVDKLVLWDGLDQAMLGAPDAQLRGWHRGGADAAAWTDGSAELELPMAGDETFLDIHLAATMRYRPDSPVPA